MTTLPSPACAHDRGLDVAGGFTGYRARTFAMIRRLVASTGGVDRGVDVGAGDGWMARRLMDDGLVRECTPVDVVRRASVIVEPVLYDGARLPFADRSVDLAYAVDAAHHAADPLAFLFEMARVSRRFILLKDHTCTSAAGAAMLRILDEIGNRRFAINSPGHYQRGFAWLDALRGCGFVPRTLLHPAGCHVGPLALTNCLQFVALLERPSGH